MSEHEVSRVVQAPQDSVFALVADPARLPQWLPTVEQAEASLEGDGTEVVHLEGETGSRHYTSDGFWRPEAVQRRVEWGTASRDGQPATYAGWLQLHERDGGTEVVLHLSFLEDAPSPRGVEEDLGRALEALADLVER